MMSILLVDSETVVATALQATLNRFGFEVELADSGNAAHAWLTKAQFDRIVVDFDLSPRPNGEAVLEPSKSATGCWSGTGLIRELRAARIISPILVYTVLEGELLQQFIRFHSKRLRNLFKNSQPSFPLSVFQAGNMRTLRLSMIGEDLL
jgi:CheY-like chemotaxis protein